MKISAPPHPAFQDGRPLEIGRRFLIVPGEAPAQAGGRIPIRLSRGKAFGSGLHETTISCVEALEDLAQDKGGSVLDVGTGTGVLSLSAVLLGAKRAVALDIDAEAARVCRRNAVLNGVDDRLSVFTGTLEAVADHAAFSLVLANIHGDIILGAAGRLVGHTAADGYLVLSGIDYTDSGGVKAVMKRCGMEEVCVRFLENFVTQVWRRPAPDFRKAP